MHVSRLRACKFSPSQAFTLCAHSSGFFFNCLSHPCIGKSAKCNLRVLYFAKKTVDHWTCLDGSVYFDPKLGLSLHHAHKPYTLLSGGQPVIYFFLSKCNFCCTEIGVVYVSGLVKENNEIITLKHIHCEM